jgi:putative transposase
MREVANAILYFLSGQGGWDRLPKDFPPKSTVYDYYAAWRSDRTLSRLWIAICEDAP